MEESIIQVLNPYWTGSTYIYIYIYIYICPPLVKGLEGHICRSVVTSWRCHCDVIESIMNLVVAKNILPCGQRDMCSWSIVNNEENGLPWQIKDWLNKNNKKFPKSAQSMGLAKFQIHSPQRVNIIRMTVIGTSPHILLY